MDQHKGYWALDKAQSAQQTNNSPNKTNTNFFGGSFGPQYLLLLPSSFRAYDTPSPGAILFGKQKLYEFIH
jgi:hypothetical protein